MNSIGTSLAQCAARLCLIGWLAGSLLAQGRPAETGLIAHEWGTFTSVAGPDGRSVEWLPFGPSGPADLPDFVEHLHWVAFKQGLRGTVRMETPVLYFYSEHDVKLAVRVGFKKGIITEWYPHADEPVRDGSLADAEIYRQRGADGSIFWSAVAAEPGTQAEFPQSGTGNRYYAARQTSSVPLRVRTATVDQHEKFLFYRGVAGFEVPLSAEFTTAGKVSIRNSFEDPISNLIWFERRGGQVGYRVSQEVGGEMVLEPPELTSRLEHLYGDLEETLVASGLYRDEAHAMVETWHDTWFEEGSRLLYIVPTRFVNSVLPLTIAPAPEQITRVFVGRMELVNPATRQAVAAALAAGDEKALAKHGRFLRPIIEIVQKSNPQPSPSPSNAPCELEPANVSRPDPR